MTDTVTEGMIRGGPAPRCMACHEEGVVIHSRLRDRLFGAGGDWTLKRCFNRECGLVWLDPMPLPEEIGKAYRNYYTHQSGGEPGRPGLIKRLYRVIKRGYLGRIYQYPTGPLPLLSKSMGWLLFLVPGRRHQVDEAVRFLPALPGGRLLDVGCGSGEWLASMCKLGWHGEGVDDDAVAVAIARQRGFRVGCGPVEEQSYPSHSFEAITLNHVIEHVPDPVRTLTECARLLAPGGKLVILTPNVASLGHRLFGANWRGLEPPRHLHLMTPRSLRLLLNRAGLINTRVGTRNSAYMLRQSVMQWAGCRAGEGHGFSRVGCGCAGWGLTCLEAALLKVNESIGECIVTISEGE